MNSLLRSACLSVAAVALAISSCSSVQSGNSSDAGELTVETSPIPGIKGIDVSQVRVKYIPSDSQKIVVTAPEKIHECLQIKVTDSILNIHVDNNLKSVFSRNGRELSKTVVEVYAVNVRDFDISAGASVKVMAPLKIAGPIDVSASSGSSFGAESLTAPDIRLVASSGASVGVGVESESLSAKVSSGASIGVEGKAQAVNLSASSGASLNAKKLVASTGSASASSGSSISCNIANEAKVSSNSGGSVSNSQGK